MLKDQINIEGQNFNWYILYTFPNYEKRILKISTQKNITCFLPTCKVIRQWNDRKKIIDVPLFPNYLFVYTTNQNRFTLLDIAGASRYITCGGKPVTISDEEIHKIKKMANSGDISLERNFIAGETVQINSGPFIGLAGVVFNRRGKDRFAVRIEGINNVISIPLDNLTVTKMERTY